MADLCLLKKNRLTPAHLPTGMLIIGYPVFWGEILFFRANYGVTTPSAWVLLVLLVFYIFIRQIKESPPGLLELKTFFLRQSRRERFFVTAGSICSVILLAIGLRAALLPPHLPQELDVLNYHYTFPRQHLIVNSFQYIRWSTWDLFPLPVQFALSPFWFSTVLPNKFPQFIFFIGTVLVSVNLLRRLNEKEPLRIFLVIFAVLGAHHVGIQAGTAMLDLVLCYLFLAALDSFWNGDALLAAVEFAFYFCSKSFVPIQMGILAMGMFLILAIAARMNFRIGLSFSRDILSMKETVKAGGRKFILMFLIFSVLIGGPFVMKSLYYLGTPVYPFFVGMMGVNPELRRQNEGWHSLMIDTQTHINMRDAYGDGRSFAAFLKHLWLIAVPEKGVNNKYDYPLGLVYVICLGPFLFLLVRDFFQKRIAVLPLFIILFWLSWWMGSQQSRFLFVPLLLMYIIVCADIKKASFLLQGVTLLAIVFNTISVYRAHKNDFWKNGLTAIRTQDLHIVDLNREYIASGRKDSVALEYREAAFAQFPLKEQISFMRTTKEE